MTNEERLMEVQAIEIRQRNIFFICASILALALLAGVTYYGSRLIQQRQAAAAARRAVAAETAARQAEQAGTVLEGTVFVGAVGSEIRQGAFSFAQTRVQAAEAAKAAAEAYEAAAEEVVSRMPEGYVMKEVTEDDIHKGILQLINKDNAYHFLENDLLSNIYDQEGGNYYLSSFQIQMTKETCDHLHQFLGAFYEETGFEDILVLNGFRSIEESQSIYDRDVEIQGQAYADAYNMPPGYSEHHSGMATDLAYFSTGEFLSDDDSKLSWFYEHACDYGFILRYPENKQEKTQIALEGWHLRYVGVAAATDMYRKDLCMEEWIDMIHEYSVDQPYTIATEAGTYTLYYAEAMTDPATGKIEIPVPGSGNYTISGDNLEGYIVVIEP